MKKKTIEEFIKQAKEIHGDKYTYIDYINDRTKIDIICKIHGTFSQSPNNHLTKQQGCPKCGRIKYNNKKFIENAIKIHGDKYDYSLIEYNNDKVVIICKKHGEFKQRPHNHLQGQNCPKCSSRRKFNKEDFIEKAKLTHGNKYNYDNVNYINNSIKIDILCNKHGIFKQQPRNHLMGQDCPFCVYKKSKGELKIENLLKENDIKYKPQYSFSDLKDKGVLKFDFGILDENGNLLYLIEFNGKQHYYYNKKFYESLEDFHQYQYRDKLKQEYCVKNNIPLYIIRYDEDIDISKINKKQIC